MYQKLLTKQGTQSHQVYMFIRPLSILLYHLFVNIFYFGFNEWDVSIAIKTELIELVKFWIIGSITSWFTQSKCRVACWTPTLKSLD